MVTRNEIVAADFYQRYIGATKGDDVLKALSKNTRLTKKFLRDIPRKKIDFAYAEGKWTIKEVLQHVIDAERVFAYRALTFARRDTTPLPGFEENEWAAAVHARATGRKWSGLVDEFKAVRHCSELLFESFGDGELRATGMASGRPLNTFALGFIIAGHFTHHIGIINERYL